MQCRISTVGQERRVVDFNEGESLGTLFSRIGIDIPTASGVEVWINGEKSESWSSHRLQDNDAIVLMPNLKGAKPFDFVARRFAEVR
jgi:hypothetical protein